MDNTRILTHMIKMDHHKTYHQRRCSRTSRAAKCRCSPASPTTTRRRSPASRSATCGYSPALRTATRRCSPASRAVTRGKVLEGFCRARVRQRGLAQPRRILLNRRPGVNRPLTGFGRPTPRLGPPPCLGRPHPGLGRPPPGLARTRRRSPSPLHLSGGRRRRQRECCRH